MNSTNLVSLMAQTKQYESHRRKVDSIMTRSSHSLSFRRSGEFNNFYSSRDKAARYTQRAKQEAVEKENDIILKKIIDVNRRKDRNNTGQKRDSSHNNLTNLRKKIEKTNEENQKLANKLVGATSKLNQDTLNQNYRRYAEIKQRLRKYTVDEETGSVVTKKVKSLAKLGRLEPLYRQVYGSRMAQNEQYDQ